MVDHRFPVSVHIMTALAYHEQHGDKRATSEYLAASIRTNPTVIRRLVSRLAEAGLIHSYKGKSGGIELAKKPVEITLKEIYSAVLDKQLIQSPDKAPKKQCPVSCSMKKIMGEVIDGLETRSLDYLGGIRLADLVGKIHN
ncbi:MAG: Rrf2 family transcriptional regulator [Bdellovibrionota bacterium]